MQDPIPEKLQRAIIKAYNSGWGSYEDVAELFDVSRTTVDRVLRKARQKEPLVPKTPAGGRKPPIKLSDEPRLLDLIESNADATIDEIKRLWGRMVGQIISRSSWQRELHRLGYSKKEKVMKSRRLLCPEVARKRVEYLRVMPSLPVEKLKFLDESGLQVHLQRERAWSKKGVSPVFHGHVRPGRNFTVIGAMSLWGLEAMTFQDHAMKKSDFERFIDTTLAPKIAHGDIIVMDNLQSHRSLRVAESLTLLGASALFLPPYSPDLNPIEELWHCFKSIVRKNNNLLAEGPPCYEAFGEVVRLAWESLNVRDLRGLVGDSGYRVS